MSPGSILVIGLLVICACGLCWCECLSEICVNDTITIEPAVVNPVVDLLFSPLHAYYCKVG